MSWALTGCPKRAASPSVGGNSPVSILIVVVLPQPLEPMKPNISPRRIRMVTWSTATKSPNRLVSPRDSMAISSPSAVTKGTSFTSVCSRRFSSGRSAMNAASSEPMPVCRCRSAGAPVASTFPSFITTSHSNCSASSMYAVATITLMPGRSARNRAISSQNCRRARGSTPVVGSSRMSRSGSWMSAQHSPSFCFMPPESLPTGRSRNWWSPVLRVRSSMRRRLSAALCPNNREKNCKFSSMDSVG